MLYYDKTLACDDSVVTKLGHCYAFVLDLFLQRHKPIPDVTRHIDDASFFARCSAVRSSAHFLLPDWVDLVGVILPSRLPHNGNVFS